MSDEVKTPVRSSKHTEKEGDVKVSVHKEMTINEIVTLFPQAADIMVEYGLHCFSCSIGGVETLEEGCSMHGIDEEMLMELLCDINEAMASVPPRSQEITITEAAARAVLEIAKKEGREREGLAVIPDGSGGFCMEFRNEPEEGDCTFSNRDVPEVCVFVSPLVLWRIGGASIDFRDGRFKLDLDEKAHKCGCTSHSCGCREKVV